MTSNKDKNLRLIGVNADFVSLHRLKPIKASQGFSTTLSAQIPLVGLPSMQGMSPENIQQPQSTQEALISEKDIEKLDALPSDSLGFLGETNSLLNEYNQLKNQELGKSQRALEIKEQLSYLTSPAYLSYLKQSKELYNKALEKQKDNTSSLAVNDNEALIVTNEGFQRVGINELYKLNPSTFRVATVGEALDYRARVGKDRNDLMGVIEGAGKKDGFLEKVAKSADTFIGKADSVSAVEFAKISEISALANQNISTDVMTKVKSTLTGGHKISPEVKGFVEAVDAIYSDLSTADLRQREVFALQQIQNTDDYNKLEKDENGNLTQEANRKLQRFISNAVKADISAAVARALDPREKSITDISVEKELSSALGLGSAELERANPIIASLSASPVYKSVLTADDKETGKGGSQLLQPVWVASWTKIPNRITQDGEQVPLKVNENPVLEQLLNEAWLREGSGDPGVYVGGKRMASTADKSSDPNIASPGNFTLVTNQTQLGFTYEPYMIDPNDGMKKPMRYVKKGVPELDAFLKAQQKLFANSKIPITQRQAAIQKLPEFIALQNKYQIELVPSVIAEVGGKINPDWFGDNSSSNLYSSNYFRPAPGELDKVIEGLPDPPSDSMVSFTENVATSLIIPVLDLELLRRLPFDDGSMKAPEVGTNMTPASTISTSSREISFNNPTMERFIP